MSDMLSRWLEGATRQSRQEAGGTTVEQARTATSEPDNAVSTSQSSTQSAALSSASVRDDGEQPSTSRESDYSRNKSGSSTNQAKKMKSASNDESVSRRALSGSLVGPSGAGAREMVCRLAKQLTFDVGGPTMGELHGGVKTDTHDEDSGNDAASIGSSKGDGEDLRKFEVEHDVAVTDHDVAVTDNVAVRNDNVMSLTDTDKQKLLLFTDMMTDQQMEDVSHETELGDVAGNELAVNSAISDQDLRMREPSVDHGDTTVDCANSEIECNSDDVRQDINFEQSSVRLSGVKSFVNTMVELEDDAAVNRSRCGSSHTENKLQQAPSSVSSIKRKTKQSTPDSHPMIGVNRGTIRFALAKGHPCTQSDTPGVANRIVPAAYSVQSRGGIANHQLMPTEQPSDLLDDPMSIVGPDLDMSTNSAVDSGSDMSTCSGEDYEALKEKTLSAETCSITQRPHNPLPTSSIDLQKPRCQFKTAMYERSEGGMTQDSTDRAPVRVPEEETSVELTDDSMKISISEESDNPSLGATSRENQSLGSRASAVGMHCLF